MSDVAMVISLVRNPAVEQDYCRAFAKVNEAVRICRRQERHSRRTIFAVWL